MTCKKCVHDRVCVIQAFPEAFENTQWEKSPCDHFAKASGWISVDERLPEDGSPVIVYLKSGGITIARYDMAWGRFRTSGSITVTHWMPLPEPPKGE